MAGVRERRFGSVCFPGACGAVQPLFLSLPAARSARHRAMTRTLLEEVLHLLICQTRPVREFSLFHICFFRAPGA
eukprot:7491441-Pyramimonas_sp.AAC.1